ncbi:UNVERIFIED_CONTAM: Adenylate cyclase type 10 [Siphonaria sp. JEL0065]|nr:Adenylate cyclase type 10 [Siphonaria sp. JEL0065]
MRLLSLVPQHIRDLISKPEVRDPPWADISDFGMTAIIDISGYSKLTSHLQTFYGNDGGAKVKELLNPPIIEIIKRVQDGYGSIVKFSGDAIIASWTATATLSPEEKELLTLKALLCCLELLSFFSDYNIKIPVNSKDVFPISPLTITPISTPASTTPVSTNRQSVTTKRTSAVLPPQILHRRSSMQTTSTPPQATQSTLPIQSAITPNTKRRMSGNPSNLQIPNRNSLVGHVLSAHSSKKGSTDVIGDSTSDVCWKPQPLKIHIGLGFGKTSHIHVGDGYNGSLSAKPRIEYFIAGDSMKSASEFLAIGTEGDFVFSPELTQFLAPELQVELLKYSDHRMSFGMKYRIISSAVEEAFDLTNPFMVRIINISGNANVSKFSRSMSQLNVADVPSVPIISRATAFMDDGIKRVIVNSITDLKVTSPEANIEQLLFNISHVFENYDQLRNVSVLFLKMPSFAPETLHEPTNLSILQQAIQIVLGALKKFEGCLRQFNCDDKGVTALLVWGLDGFSHEKGESPLVIGAALHMLGPLKKLFGKSFSIGISTGSVFSGIVGNSKRCDGTILGVSVNNAARFMCLPMCEGTIICDEETYNATKTEYMFKADYEAVTIKGMTEPVAIFTPQKKARGSSVKKFGDESQLVGRELEKARIQTIAGAWKAGSCESILITGRSGVGKSAIRNYCERQLIQEKNVFICTGQSLEHQQKAPLYIFGELLRELSHHIKHRINMKDVSPVVSNRGSRYSTSMTGSFGLKSNRSSMMKPGGGGLEVNDRRKSVALSILESAQSISSHRVSFAAPILFNVVDSPQSFPSPPPTTRHYSIAVTEHKRRTSIVADFQNIIMGRRSTVDNSRVSGVTPPEEVPAVPKSRTESASSKQHTSSIRKSSSQMKSIDTSKSMIRNPNYLAAPGSASVLGSAGLASKSTESYVSAMKSTRSTIIDHGAIVTFLQNLGEPQSSIDLLKYVPGIMDSSESNNQMAADIIPRLSGIFANIFESLQTLGVKITLIFDDLQWCDSYSYDLLTSLMRKCPFILYILSCRPAEEWSKMYLDRFFALSGLSKHKIPLTPFRYESIEELIRHKFKGMMSPTDTVSNTLVKDVLERSQGIALVTNIFINMLFEESLLKVKNNSLTYVDESSAIELPSEAVGAIVSQFDKLTAPLKVLLRLAAVCGQYFDTVELSQIIESSASLRLTLSVIDCTPSGLYNLITNSDKYKFIKRGDTINTLAFTHYLIQQGILSTVIPSKREEMHEMLANFYQEKLKDDKASDHRTHYTEILIFHLMQINGQFERKQAIILRAFIDSATIFRSSEALEYYELLVSIRKESQVVLSNLELSKESRLLGQIYYELGDQNSALVHYYNSLSLLGYKIPSSWLHQTLTAYFFIRAIRHFIKVSAKQQHDFSIELLCTKFPAIAEAVRAAEEFDRPAVAEALFTEVSVSIAGLIRILAVNKRSLDYILFNAFATCLMGCDQNDWKLRYCLTYLLISQATQRYPFKQLSYDLSEISNGLYSQVLEEYKVENMSSMQTVMYSELVRCKAQAARICGLWRIALEHFQNFEALKTAIGLGTSDDAFWCRSKIVEMLTILGEFSGADYDREQTLKWYNNNNCDAYMQSAYLIQQAVVQCSLGNIEEASKSYLENAHVPLKTVTNANAEEHVEDLEKRLLFQTCCLTICVSVMHYVIKKDDLFIWRNRAETHSNNILKEFRKLPQANGAIIFTIISTLSDWFIFEDGSNQLQQNRSQRGDPEFELLKFFTRINLKGSPPLLSHLNHMSKGLILLRQGKRQAFCSEIDKIVEAAKEKLFLTEYHSILLLTYKWMVGIQSKTRTESRDADAQAYSSYFQSMDYKFRCDVIERRMLKNLQTTLSRTKQSMSAG